MSHLKKAIKRPWRSLLGVTLASLVILSTLGCTHAKSRTPTEIWLIDYHRMVLYRNIGNGTEQVIPIQNNRDMKGFLCMSESSFADMVEGLLEKSGE